MKLPGYSTDDYLFFWGKKSPYSQHYRCEFTWYPSGENFSISTPPINFTSAEQFMMYRKAKLFDNVDNNILAADMLIVHDPTVVKSMGRKVVGFDNTIWIANRENIVIEGNMLKFYQNERLYSLLLLAGNRTFVEASPYDRIWGIGKDINDPYLLEVSEWGENLLGKILTGLKNRAFENMNKTMLWNK